MLGEWILRELCWFLVVAERRALSNENSKKRNCSINNNCSIDGCNAMRYEDSIYCLRHKPNEESKEETQQEENWWEDGD